MEQMNVATPLYTEEKLREILTLVAKGVVRPTYIAKAVNISYDTFCKWLLKSNRDDPAFLIEYTGEVMQFAKAFSLAKKLALLELRGLVEQKSIFGTSEPSLKDGNFCWQLDPAAVPLDRETRILCGYHPDALLLDAKGHAQPVMIHTDAPVGLQLRVLESAFKDFRPGVVQEVNVSGNVGIGIGFGAKQNYSGPPPAIPPMPPIPQLEVIDTIADADEPADSVDADDDDVPIAAPTAPQINLIVAPQIVQPEPEPEPIAPRDTPIAPQVVAPTNAERSGRPLSPLQIDLLRRARGTPEERSAPV
jgi:hypothetical protein